MARKLASLLLKEEMVVVADGKQRCKLLQLLHQNCAKRSLLETRFTASLRSIIKEHEKEPRNCSHFQQPPPCCGRLMLQTIKFYFQLNFSPRTQCLKITQNVAFEFFEFWHFPPIFVLLKLNCLVPLFDRKLQVIKNSPKWTILAFLIKFCSLKK